jgi:hypothetical protein
MSINELARFYAMSCERKVAFKYAKQSKKTEVKYNRFFKSLGLNSK